MHCLFYNTLIMQGTVTVTFLNYTVQPTWHTQYCNLLIMYVTVIYLSSRALYLSWHARRCYKMYSTYLATRYCYSTYLICLICKVLLRYLRGMHVTFCYLLNMHVTFLLLTLHARYFLLHTWHARFCCARVGPVLLTVTSVTTVHTVELFPHHVCMAVVRASCV